MRQTLARPRVWVVAILVWTLTFAGVFCLFAFGATDDEGNAPRLLDLFWLASVLVVPWFVGMVLLVGALSVVVVRRP